MRTESNHDTRNRLHGISRRAFLKQTSAAAAGLLIGYSSAQGTNATVALINGILVDGTGADAVPNGAVVIQNGRILSAGPHTQLEIPASANIIDV